MNINLNFYLCPCKDHLILGDSMMINKKSSHYRLKGRERMGEKVKGKRIL